MSCRARSLDGLPSVDQLWPNNAQNSNESKLLVSATCEACVLGKAHRKNFKRHRDTASLATTALQRVHADVCGPIRVPRGESIDSFHRMVLPGYTGATYFSTRIDEASRITWVSILHLKSDECAKVKQWVAEVERQSGLKLKEFHTDGGTEYGSLDAFFKQHGIIHTVTQPYTPQHNGIAERMNRSLLEKAKAMLFHA